MRPPTVLAWRSVLFSLLLFALAFVGAVYPGTNTRPAAPLVAALSCTIVGICVWRGSRTTGVSGWASAIAAALAAGLLPLATEGAPSSILSNLALAATAGGSCLALSPAGGKAYSGGILMAAASALTPAGVLAPLASAWGTRHKPLRGLGFLTLAALGLAAGLWVLPAAVPKLFAFVPLPRGLAGYASGRDLLLLLPLAMLGLAGVIIRRTCSEAEHARWQRSWASVGVFALLFTLFFGGLDLRLCLLPLLWWSPAGLAELRQALSGGTLIERAVTFAAAVTLLVLAAPAVSLWTRALLVAALG